MSKKPRIKIKGNYRTADKIRDIIPVEDKSSELKAMLLVKQEAKSFNGRVIINEEKEKIIHQNK